MTKYTPIIAVALLIAISAPHQAEAWCWWRCKPKAPQTVTPTKPVAVTPIPTPAVVKPPVVAPAAVPLAAGETVIQAWTTAYTYFDNDPPGSAEISNPIVHKSAGGTGTYADPITLAVGYVKSTPDITPGTRYYMPNLKRYFIVEDTCAACHAGYKGGLWLDLWIDGAKTTAAKADECARAQTAIHTFIKNPKSTYPVVPGVISGSVCAPQYGDLLTH